jgi:hypothetical protein
MIYRSSSYELFQTVNPVVRRSEAWRLPSDPGQELQEKLFSGSIDYSFTIV